MEKRYLGPDRLEVSAIGLGCMGMTYSYGVIHDTNEMIKLIHEAMELGLTFFDTAEVYGPYNNEELLGKALAGRRDRAVISTKCGIYIRHGKQEVDNDLKLLRASLEGSLKRLQTDCIDLYFLHRFSGEVPIEEIAGLMADFKKDGKIKHWGLSEAGVQTIEKAHAVLPLTAVESEYSMMWRGPEEGLLSVLEERNIGFIPFAPLCKGFLTGTITADTQFGENDNRRTASRFHPENLAANQVMVEFIRELAAARNVQPTQIALAWLLAQKPFIVPIPGTTKLSRLKDNLAAAEISFTPSELAEINEKLAQIKVSGHRYSAAFAARAGK